MKVLSCLLFFAIIPQQVRALTEKEAKAIYQEDKQKVLAGDLSFDWQKFRLAAKEGGAGYFDWHSLRNSFMQKMKDGKADAALKDADIIIGHNMAEPEGHLLAMMAYKKLSKPDEAAYQHKIVAAWVDSLQKSGDGKAPSTAFVVVDEGEEYFYLNVVLGVGLPTSQSLVQRDGHSYDLLKIKDRQGNNQELWFNVDISMAAMSEALGAAKK